MRAILFLFLIFHLSSQSYGFEVFSNVKNGFTDSTSITYNYNITSCSDTATTLANITEALKAWGYIPMSRLGELKLGSAVSTTAAQAIADTTGQYSNPPVIICDPNFKTTFSGNSINDVALAIGGPITNGGTVVGGYVVINVDATSSTGYYQNLTGFPSVVLVTHELGHSLGLAHSTDQDAMMKDGGNSTMGRDDFEGIKFLYPRSEGFDKTAFGCGAIASGKSSEKFRWSILIFLFCPLGIYLNLKFRFARGLFFKPVA